MEIKKMSLANMDGKLTRKEMKNIMAGSSGCKTVSCSVYVSGTTYYGSCGGKSGGNTLSCYCLTSYGDYQVGNSSGMSNCFN